MVSASPERFAASPIGSTEAAVLELRSRDARALALISDAIAAFPNTANWYHNASFLLPLAAAIAVGLLGGARHSTELLGFGAFLAVVTLAMLPIVLAGWRHTATAVVVTGSRVVSLHEGRVLKELDWARVRHVRMRETQGNVRWEIAADGGEALLLDGELEDLPRLALLAQELSEAADRGLTPGPSPGRLERGETED